MRLAGEAEAEPGTRVLSLTEARQRFTFEGLAERPVPSLLRGFSAPVKLAPQPRERLAFLFAHDSDPFNRWEAGQQLATQLLLEGVAARKAGRELAARPGFRRRRRPAAGRRRRSTPPSSPRRWRCRARSFLADQMALIDVEGIHAVREAARLAIATALRDRLLALYRGQRRPGPVRRRRRRRSAGGR